MDTKGFRAYMLAHRLTDKRVDEILASVDKLGTSSLVEIAARTTAHTPDFVQGWISGYKKGRE